MSNVYVSTSIIPDAGRGVFALKNISKGEVIETCPVLVMPFRDVCLLEDTLLKNYCFRWNDSVSVCLGYGSLYNHSYTPNAVYKKNLSNEEINFIALKNIIKDEEITINYNGEPNSKKTLWIEKIKPYK